MTRNGTAVRDGADDPSAARSGAVAGRTLRLVPGGYDINSWPTHVPLEPGEHLLSWLARLAMRLGIAPRDVLMTAAPNWHSVRDRHPSRWPLERLAARARVEFAALESAHLSSLQVAYDDYAARYQRPAIPVSWQSRFCPGCLAESDAWPASWAHPLHLICAQHSMSLVVRCGRCGKAPRADAAWMSRPTPGFQCPNRVPASGAGGARKNARFCDADLRRAPTRVVRRVELAAQVWLLDCLEQVAGPADHRTTVAGWECSAAEVLDATFEIVIEHLGSRKAHRVPNWHVTDALRVARGVLTSPSVPDAIRLADRHHVLSPTGPVTPIVMSRVLRARRHNPLLVGLRLASLGDQLSVANQLMYRTGSLRPSYPEASAGDDVARGDSAASRGPSQVPQLLWPGVLCDGRDVRARAALSIALAKVGSLMPLRAIAVDLELPASIADHIRMWWRRLGDDRGRVVRALDGLYESLVGAPPPIDYRHHRRVGWDKDPFLAAASDALSSARSQIAVEELAWHLWSAYTGSVTSAHWEPAHQDTSVVREHHLDNLDAAWSALKANLGCADEPLTWRPP